MLNRQLNASICSRTSKQLLACSGRSSSAGHYKSALLIHTSCIARDEPSADGGGRSDDATQKRKDKLKKFNKLVEVDKLNYQARVNRIGDNEISISSSRATPTPSTASSLPISGDSVKNAADSAEKLARIINPTDHETELQAMLKPIREIEARKQGAMPIATLKVSSGSNEQSAESGVAAESVKTLEPKNSAEESMMQETEKSLKFVLSQ